MIVTRYRTLSLWLIVFLFVSCNKCIETELPSVLFTQMDLNINPYKTLDTILFISTLDTIMFFGSRVTSSGNLYEHGSSSDELLNERCKGTYYYTQASYTSFHDLNNNTISIYLYLPNLFYPEHQFYPNINEKTICLNLDLYYNSISKFSARYSFENDSIFPCSEPYGSETIENYYNSFKLGPYTYYNVYCFNNGIPAWRQIDTLNYVDRVYYSISDGFIGFTLKNGQYYYVEMKL